ncbi:MAG TPA: Mth938-like domain-containing protein [Acidimicrobiia bacterium]|jgi:hypothetical protein|nr:Mth938-like domain-containing protein [Acidimicrobiia bacterium]
MTAISPRVNRLEWGQVHTEIGSFRDVKLWPGGGRGWDWTETGTHHSPGVHTSDIRELLDNGATTIVIGRGQLGRLEVTDQAMTLIGDRDAEAVVLESDEAITRYNTLAAAGVQVGALIHSTC